MNNERKNFLYFMLLNTAFCVFYFLPLLLNINSSLIAWGGDGLKNYFTYLYYVKYDHGVLFTGMNYPFGEHMTFTDNMPVLSGILVQLKSVFPGIANYALLFMHSMMMLSFFVAAIFVFKILKLLGVKGWWAIFSAIFIAYFSPQFQCLGGHFSLSLACFVPIMLYYVMQYQKKAGRKYPVYLALALVFFSFCHVYFLAMGMVIILSFCLSDFLTSHKPRLRKIRSYVPLISAFVFAILVFKTYLLITDTIKDRPKFPIGFLSAATTGEDIFTSAFSPLGSIFNFLFGIGPNEGTGLTYLGLISILTALFLIYRIIRSLIVRWTKKQLIPTHPLRIYRPWLLTALFCLLFSMGAPFLWGLEFLIEYFSTFRQFRALVRFSWIFYFIMMIYVAVFLYRFYFFRIRKSFHNKWLIKAFAVLVVLINALELGGYVHHIHDIYKDGTAHYKEYYSVGKGNWNDWLLSKGYPKGYFQAGIGLPYFHIGSEQIGIQGVGESYTLLYGSQLSFQTGIPMTDVMMSRTSWSQTYAQMSLIDGLFAPKDLFKQYNQKPVLLFVNSYENLLPGTAWLVSEGKMIGNNGGLDLYEINIDTLLKHKQQQEDSIIAVIRNKPETKGFISSNLKYYYNNHLDEIEHANAFQTKGAYNEHSSSFNNKVLELPVTHPDMDTSFVISCWMKNIDNAPDMPYIVVEQYNSKNEKIYASDFLAGCSTYRLNGWFKGERRLIIKPETTKITLYATGGKKSLTAVDEILIRPEGEIYYDKISESVWMINNRPVKVK